MFWVEYLFSPLLYGFMQRRPALKCSSISLAVAFSSFYVNKELRQRLVPDVFDKAGIFTKRYLSNEDLSKLVIVGSDLSGLFRSLFYVDNPKSSLETIPKGSSYDLSKLAAGKEWILVIGDHSLSANT
jgi:phosphoglycerol transferase